MPNIFQLSRHSACCIVPTQTHFLIRHLKYVSGQKNRLKGKKKSSTFLLVENGNTNIFTYQFMGACLYFYCRRGAIQSHLNYNMCECNLPFLFSFYASSFQETQKTYLPNWVLNLFSRKKDLNTNQILRRILKRSFRFPEPIAPRNHTRIWYKSGGNFCFEKWFVENGLRIIILKWQSN